MDTFVGFITPFPYTFAPYQWHLCDGAQIQITQNQVLYSLLGVAFGGDSRTYFNLPNLQGRTVVGMNANNASPFQYAAVGGSASVTLNSTQVPAPAVSIKIANAAGDNPSPTNGAYLGNAVSNPADGTSAPLFVTGTPTSTFTLGGVAASGGGASPVNIQNPYLALRYCIAMQGLYPTRS